MPHEWAEWYIGYILWWRDHPIIWWGGLTVGLTVWCVTGSWLKKRW